MKSLKNLFAALWSDESGAILSAEAALLGTVGVVGAGAGLSAVSETVDAELKDVAFAIRSLDQSYSIPQTGCECGGKAWTAGSSFKQEPVAKSHRELQQQIDRLEAEAAATDEKAVENERASKLQRAVNAREAAKRMAREKAAAAQRAAAEQKAAAQKAKERKAAEENAAKKPSKKNDARRKADLEKKRRMQQKKMQDRRKKANAA